MTFYRGRKIIVVCLAAVAVTLGASASGLAVDQFLAGVFGGGALTAMFLTLRNRGR